MERTPPPPSPQVATGYRAPIAPWALWAQTSTNTGTGATPKKLKQDGQPTAEQTGSEKSKKPKLGDFLTPAMRTRKRHAAQTQIEPPTTGHHLATKVSFRPEPYLTDIQHFFQAEETSMVQPFQDILWANKADPNTHSDWTEIRLALDMALMLSQEP